MKNIKKIQVFLYNILIHIIGIYVKIENKDNNPTLLVRDSQILAIIGLNLGFYVDKDSSNYP